MTALTKIIEKKRFLFGYRLIVAHKNMNMSYCCHILVPLKYLSRRDFFGTDEAYARAIIRKIDSAVYQDYIDAMDPAGFVGYPKVIKVMFT